MYKTRLLGNRTLIQFIPCYLQWSKKHVKVTSAKKYYSTLDRSEINGFYIDLPSNSHVSISKNHAASNLKKDKTAVTIEIPMITAVFSNTF